MKKLFLFVFLALMFCNIAKATSLTPLIEYFEKNKTTDPAVQVYTFYRCAAVYSFSTSLLLKTNEEEAKQFVNTSSNFALMAFTVLVDKLDNEKDVAKKKTISIPLWLLMFSLFTSHSFAAKKHKTINEFKKSKENYFELKVK